MGKEDPEVFGKQVELEKEEKAKGGFPCPSSEYAWAREIKNVADWSGLNIIEARELRHKDPWFFSLIYQSHAVEQEAEPIQIKVAQAEAEAEAKHTEAANHAYSPYGFG